MIFAPRYKRIIEKMAEGKGKGGKGVGEGAKIAPGEPPRAL